MPSIGFENFRMGIRSLKSSRFRTFLSTFGIVIGVGSLLAVLNLGDSLERYSRAQIDRTTSLGIIEVTAKSSETVDGIKRSVFNNAA
jgi:putative ABC transport system permease protein